MNQWIFKELPNYVYRWKAFVLLLLRSLQVVAAFLNERTGVRGLRRDQFLFGFGEKDMLRIHTINGFYRGADSVITDLR